MAKYFLYCFQNLLQLYWRFITQFGAIPLWAVHFRFLVLYLRLLLISILFFVLFSKLNKQQNTKLITLSFVIVIYLCSLFCKNTIHSYTQVHCLINFLADTESFIMQFVNIFARCLFYKNKGLFFWEFFFLLSITQK